MKHKTRTKALSWLLTLAMVVGLVPGISLTALADGTTYNPASAYTDYAALNSSDTVVKIDEVANVEWYVIGYNSDAKTVTLLSKTSFGMKAFGFNGNSYASSEIKTFVEGLTGGGQPLAGIKEALADISVTGEPSISGAVPYLLSKDEADMLDGTKKETYDCSDESDGWWLRSPGSDDTAAFVLWDGDVYDYGGAVNTELDVRPALTLDLSKVTFDSSTKTFNVGPSHPHSFTYSATGATITATCSVDGCTLPDDGNGNHTATLTIAAPAESAEAGGAATITDAAGIQGTAKVMYESRTAEGWSTPSEAVPGTAGVYRASITLGTATASVTYGVNAITKGTVTGEKCNFTVPRVATFGAKVTPTLTIAPGYEVKKITVKNGSTDVSTTVGADKSGFTMPDYSVTVDIEFVKIDYTITKNSMTHGSVTVQKDANEVTTAQIGDPITLTASPEPNYELTSLTVKDGDNADVPISGTGDTRTFVMRASNVTVFAVFEGVPFGITISDAITGGTVTAKQNNASVTQARAGSEVTLTAAPATGFTFSSYTVKTESNEIVEVTDNKFTMPAEAVTVTATFTGHDTTAALNVIGGTETTRTAKLLDGSYREINSVTKKGGEEFILLINRDTDYDFDVTYDTDSTVSMREFTTAEYDAYATYAKANNIAVSSDMVLAWVMMPGVSGDSVTLTVTFSKVQSFTILYQPSNTDTTAVWCKFAKTEQGKSVTSSARMHNDAVMGDGTKVFSLKVRAAFNPNQVAFVTAESSLEGAPMIDNVTVSENTDTWNNITSGKYLVIGGNTKTVIAAFVTDADAATVYHSDEVRVDHATATDGVTYRLAVVTENGGTVTPGTVTAPAAPTAPTGKNFAGWRGFQYDGSGKASEQIYAAGATGIPVRENTVFHAVWKPITLTVTLNRNGGTGGSNTTTVTYGNSMTIPELPTRSGFALDGWKTANRVTEDGKLFAKGSPFDLSTNITNDLGLTAQWKHVHSYTCYKISDFGLAGYESYENYIHVAICGCNDIRLEAHSLDSNGVCACGYGKTPETVTLKYSYGQWAANAYTAKTAEATKSAKKGQETSVYAPDAWGELNFSKWQYSTDNGSSWNDLTSSPMVSFIIPCDMSLRALYVNDTVVPQVELSTRAYDDQATVNGQTVTMDNILYQMHYKLPDGYTFVDAGIRLGDNAGISYYELKERTLTVDSETKAAMAGFAVLGSLISLSPETVDYSATDTYYEVHKNSVLDEMDAATLAKYMYESKPVNVEKYDPIYWEAKATTKGMSGSMATLPPLRFAQKDNQNHWIYGIGWLRYKKPDNTIETIYTDALAATVNGILEDGTKSVTKSAAN